MPFGYSISTKVAQNILNVTTKVSESSDAGEANAGDVQLSTALAAVDKLFNDDLAGARATLNDNKDSPYSALMLGLLEAITALVSGEEEAKRNAHTALSTANTQAKKIKKLQYADATAFWAPMALHYEVFNALVSAVTTIITYDADAGRAEKVKMCYHIWSVQSTYFKLFGYIFPKGIPESASVKAILKDLNDRCEAAALASRIKQMCSEKAVDNGRTSSMVWSANPTTAWSVSGVAFGMGLFEVALALVPPKYKSVVGMLVGKGSLDRGLKLLQVSAVAGNDIHSSLATMALTTFNTYSRMFGGWQCDAGAFQASCDAILDKQLASHPDGSLWIVDKAKALRNAGNSDSAEHLLRTGLAREAGYHQAKLLLSFELGWLLLSQSRYEPASQQFAAIAGYTRWSHATCFALAAGCLQELRNRTATQQDTLIQLYDKMSASFTQKGEKGTPPSMDVYLQGRISFYGAKTQRWLAEGRLVSTKAAHWSDSVCIGLATELAILFAQYTVYDIATAERLVAHFESLVGSCKSGLDTPEEQSLCQLLLGICHLQAQNFPASRKHLSRAETLALGGSLHKAYGFILPLSRFWLALLECREADADTVKAKDAEWWAPRLAAAEQRLAQVMAQSDYDMNGRTETRVGLLRSQIAIKKSSLAI